MPNFVETCPVLHYINLGLNTNWFWVFESMRNVLFMALYSNAANNLIIIKVFDAEIRVYRT